MDRQKETYRVTIAGSIINILLLAFKFAPRSLDILLP